ncbi:MAG TPA: hypothetical protein VN222_17965 [Novosphingobium sp.]|nr:hypothetical protein [Novosphingobium sp.]
MPLDLSALEGAPCKAVLALPDGGSTLVDTYLSLARKELGTDGKVRWAGITPATGFGVAHGDAPDFGEWHVAHLAGLSIVLSGSWEIETTDGMRHVFVPGNVLMTFDNSGRGHRSRTIGGPCSTLGVALDPQAHGELLARACTALASRK